MTQALQTCHNKRTEVGHALSRGEPVEGERGGGGDMEVTTGDYVPFTLASPDCPMHVSSCNNMFGTYQLIVFQNVFSFQAAKVTAM